MSASWEGAALVVAVFGPLVGVPLTVITFHLKGLRDHQLGRHADLSRRVDVMEAAVQRLEAALAAAVRDGATKEEWLRESLWARSRIERLNAAMARAEAELDGMTTLLATAERTGRLVALIGERLGAVEPAESGEKELN